MGRIIVVVCLCLFYNYALADTQKYADLFEFKQGKLQQDETWSGKVLLLSDVIVPEGIHLHIRKDSWLIFNEADLSNFGNNPNRPELIVNGQLSKPDGRNDIKIFSLGDDEVQEYIRSTLDSEIAIIKPKEEPLTDLKDNLQESKRHYAWVWAALYSIWLIL